METVNQEMQTATQEPSTQPTEDKTFTQTDVDKIVGDRLQRERSKYSDYEALKEKAGKYDEIVESGKTELQKVTERAEALQTELDSMKKAEAVRKIKTKVATETGIPAHLLTGETEEACREQAEAIKAFAKPAYPVIKDGGEVQNVKGQSTRDQFAEWFAQRTS